MTKPLQPPDSHFLSAAIGWLELGNLAESKAELGQISGRFADHPDVIEVGWAIAAHRLCWEECLELARKLIAKAPERSSGWLHQAYALRRVRDGGLAQARDALLPVYEKFPKEPIVAYNLSCYACQLRDEPAARTWLARAMAAGDREAVRQMALKDEDLRPMWSEIERM